MKIAEFKIKGMTCDHCATSIANKFKGKEGISGNEISYTSASGKFEYEPGKISKQEIIDTINSTGHYSVAGEITTGNVPKSYGMIIIGGGSAAFAAAIQARELGLSSVMINAGLPIGGTCVNVGCVPSKNLLRAAEELHRSQNARFAGIETAGRLTDFSKVIAQKRNLVLELRQKKYINVVSDMENFRQIEGMAKITSPNSVEVNGESINGSHILVASGASPFVPDIPGLGDVPYLTNEEAFELDELPASVIVLGGRYVALEIAQMFSRLGSKVTVLQRSERILPTESEDVSGAITGYLEDEGINIVTGNNLQGVDEKNGRIAVKSIVNGKERTFEAKKIIVATGRKANTNNMGLEENGVELNEAGFIKVDNYLHSSVPTIYAAGDVIGKNMFVYTAAYEGKLAVSNACLPVRKKTDYTALPWVVFTDPQVAGVGLDEAQAVASGIDAESSTLELSYVPRSIAAMDTRGFIKLIRDKATDHIVGARIVAPEGSELLMEAAMAIKFGITAEQLKEMFHPYLTLSEGMKLAAITFGKDVAELSCCAT